MALYKRATVTDLLSLPKTKERLERFALFPERIAVLLTKREWFVRKTDEWNPVPGDLAAHWPWNHGIRRAWVNILLRTYSTEYVTLCLFPAVFWSLLIETLRRSGHSQWIMDISKDASAPSWLFLVFYSIFFTEKYSVKEFVCGPSNYRTMCYYKNIMRLIRRHYSKRFYFSFYFCVKI